MTVHDLSDSRRWQKQNIIPQYKEQIVEAPKTDVSRYDHQIKLLRREMRIIGFHEQDSRISETEWAFLMGIWERVQA